MELFRWRVRSCLLLVAVVLLAEQGLARAEGQLEGSADDGGDGEVSLVQHGSLPAQQSAGGVSSPAGHGRPRYRRRKHQPQHQSKHQQEHRQAHHGTQSNPHHQQHSKHQPDSEPEPLPLPLPQPHALSRSDDAEAHDLLDCQPQPGDRLLARSEVKAEFRPLGFAEAAWFYPQNGRDQRTIHCVRVLDQRRDGYGGYPRVARGGVGHHFVELTFKSDFSRGFHFVVEVYGQ